MQTMKLVTEVEHLTYEDRLKKLRFSILDMKRFWGDRFEACQYEKGDYEKEGEGYLIRKYSDWTMKNGFKLKKYVQREFFTVKTVRHWNCLPREVVDIQSQEGSEDELNGALSNPIQWVTSLSIGRRSELDDF